MKNVKDQIFSALSKVLDNVSDQYPGSWEKLPAVQFTEEENRVYERTDNKEDKAYVRFRVDIWNNKSTSEVALLVDTVIFKLGLVRIACQDVPEPTAWKHKMMRYEGVIDMDTETVYWPA